MVIFLKKEGVDSFTLSLLLEDLEQRSQDEIITRIVSRTVEERAERVLLDVARTDGARKIGRLRQPF